MTLRTYTSCAGLALVVLSQPLVAAGPAGFYLKAFGGVSALSSSDIEIGGGTDSETSFSTGSIAGGAFGYGYGTSPWSAEIEFAYRTGDSKGGATDGGDFASTAVMLNGVWNAPSSGKLTPYLGAGIGYVTEIDFDVVSGANAGEYSDRGGVAGQIFAGVSYAVTEQFSAFGEVRYFDAGSRTLDGPGGATIGADYATLDAIIGIGYSF